MEGTQDQQRALALKKSRLSKRAPSAPKSVRKKQIKEELEHYRKKLEQVARAKDAEQTKKVYEKLVSLYAERLSFVLNEREQEQGLVFEEEKQAFTETFYSDCLRLAALADKWLEM